MLGAQPGQPVAWGLRLVGFQRLGDGVQCQRRVGQQFRVAAAVVRYFAQAELDRPFRK